MAVDNISRPIFKDQSRQKNVADPAGVEPTTDISSRARIEPPRQVRVAIQIDRSYFSTF